jgi:hypothetical protein
MSTVTETGLPETSLDELIDDARHVPLPQPAVTDVATGTVVDLNLPAPRTEIVIPDDLVGMLRDYDLYLP